MPNLFASAREHMRHCFENNSDLRHTYVSHIAMLLHDQYGITDFEERNQAARQIMALIFDL